MTATRQYIIFWYVAETVPPAVEEVVSTQRKALQNELSTEASSDTKEVAGDGKQAPLPPPFIAPEPFSKKMTLKERVAMESEGYEPVRNLGTGVDSDELTYESYLLPVEEAMRKLRGQVSSDVVRRAWEGIQLRIKMELTAEL